MCNFIGVVLCNNYFSLYTNHTFLTEYVSKKPILS